MSSKPLNWTAIAVGWATRTFGGMIVGTIIGAVFLPMFANSRAPGTPMWQNVALFSIVSIAVNAVLSIFGGYISGRIAERDEIKHAAIVGALVFVVGLLLSSLVLLRISLTQAAMQVFLTSLAIPFTIIGGAIAQAKRKPTPNSSQPHPFDPIPRL